MCFNECLLRPMYARAYKNGYALFKYLLQELYLIWCASFLV